MSLAKQITFKVLANLVRLLTRRLQLIAAAPAETQR